jgi:hypothetical protein
MRDLAQSITRMDAGLRLRCEAHETKKGAHKTGAL